MSKLNDPPAPPNATPTVARLFAFRVTPLNRPFAAKLPADAPIDSNVYIEALAVIVQPFTLERRTSSPPTNPELTMNVPSQSKGFPLARALLIAVAESVVPVGSAL